MKKESLILKWLDFNLNEQEKEAFDQLDASKSFSRISEAMKAFDGPNLDIDKGYQRLLEKRARAERNTSLVRYVSLAAAVVAIVLSVYVFTNNTPIAHSAGFGEKLALVLPDDSKVMVNAGSTVRFEEDSWMTDRTLELSGEAYFDVESGSKFTVESDQGTITVLGTEFNVKDRKGFFSVTCYEGKVSVLFKGNEYILSKGDLIRTEGNRVVVDITSLGEPGWKNDKSYFKSVPFSEVLDELERQYSLEITGDMRQSELLYTGSFNHKKLEMALQAVTIPLNLTYTKNGDQIILKSAQ